MPSENDDCIYRASGREPSLSEHSCAEYSSYNSEDGIGEGSSTTTFSRIRTGSMLDRRGSLLSTASSGTCSTNGSEFSDSISSVSCTSFNEKTQNVDEDISDTTVMGFDDSGTLIPLKVVRFGSVTVREYAVTIGSYGDLKCPITLSWEYRQRFWGSHTSYSLAQRNTTAASSQRQRSHRPGVHPLCLRDRRKWIARVQGITKADVKLLEQRSLQVELSGTERRGRSSSINDNDVMDIGVKYTRTCTDIPPRKPRKGCAADEQER